MKLMVHVTVLIVSIIGAPILAASMVDGGHDERSDRRQGSISAVRHPGEGRGAIVIVHPLYLVLGGGTALPAEEDRAPVDRRTLREILLHVATRLSTDADELRSPTASPEVRRAEEWRAATMTQIEFETVTDMRTVKNTIQRECSGDSVFELNFAGKRLHDEWIGTFVEMMLAEPMRPYLMKIKSLNFYDNSINIQGLQTSIPLLKLKNLHSINIAANYISDEDLFEKFGTAAAYDEDTPASERLVLSDSEKTALRQKIIYIERSFFGASDPAINPHGDYITSEVIRRHREYYGFALSSL